MTSSPTIVTLTPLEVESDSRTFKQAASMARFGFRSVVVEGWRSELDQATLPFELISAGPVRPRSDAPKKGDGAEVGPARAAFRSARRAVIGARRAAEERFFETISWNAPLKQGAESLRATLLFRRYLARYFAVHLTRPLRHAPAASFYYLHAFYQFPAIWALCKLHGAKFIYDAHDFYSSFRGHKFTKDPVADRWIREFERRVEALCIARAEQVITVSEGVADLIENEFGRRPAVIMNAQDTRLDRPPPVPLREAIGVGPEAFIVVIAGNSKDGIPLDLLIDAIAGCPDTVHLALVGAGYASLLPQIARLGLTKRVHLVPPVKPFEVVPFISGADAAVVPYLAIDRNMEHCLPNRFFSAVSAGLPLLYPPLFDLVRADPLGELGLTIDPSSTASLRTAILRLAGDPELRTKIRAQVRTRSERLNWAHEEGVLRELLERAGALELLSGPRG